MESAAALHPAGDAAARTSRASPPVSGLPLVAIGLFGLAVLTFACTSMQVRRLPLPAAVALAAGLAAWGFVAARWMRPDASDAPPLELGAAPRWRLYGLPLVAALAAVSWWRTAGGRFGSVGVLAWWSAVALWIAAWWPTSHVSPARSTASGRSARRLAAIGGGLLLALAIGAVFRFHRLSEIPPHPGSDHAEDLLNLVDIQDGQRPVFFPRNTGQPPLPFYFEHLLRRALGLGFNFMTLKIATATIGMLAIPAMYVLGRELGGAPFGLLAALLTAWSKWPTLGARRGLTFAWAIFPAALAVAALLKYLRTGERRSALMAGLWIGLGQFGYNAFKIVPALVPLAFALALFDRRWKGRRGRLVLDGVLATVTTILVSLPLLQYMLQRPNDFLYRVLTRAGSLERPLPAPAPVVFAENLKNMALAFHWRGDHAWINTVADEPFLDPVSGALLLAGVLGAAALALRGSRRWAFVLLSVPILTLASTLALAFPIENPGINRAAVAFPSIVALAVLPAATLVGAARRREISVSVLAAAGLLGLAALSVRSNWQSYFVRFDEQQQLIAEPTMDLVRVMKEYRARGVPYDNVYLLNTSSWIDGRMLAFELGDPLWPIPHDVAPATPVPFLLDRPLLFFFHPSDSARRAQLHADFPDGVETLIRQKFRDRNYYTYYVPRPAVPPAETH
ncbi:MAG TPA: hypothetical protein VH854_12460 [Thermoanaerobaculia bacterium]|nr:hypothetical protein [Thermoanaerobaculia bacterium]